jgi:hypothetical protein
LRHPAPPPLQPAQHLDPHRLMTLKLDLRSHASRNTPRQTRRCSPDAYVVAAGFVFRRHAGIKVWRLSPLVHDHAVPSLRQADETKWSRISVRAMLADCDLFQGFGRLAVSRIQTAKASAIRRCQKVVASRATPLLRSSNGDLTSAHRFARRSDLRERIQDLRHAAHRSYAGELCRRVPLPSLQGFTLIC